MSAHFHSDSINIGGNALGGTARLCI